MDTNTTLAHLINLDSRGDRLEKTLNEFKDIKSISINKISAVVAKPEWKTDKMPPGLVACTMSHINILKNNIDSNDHVLVIEDDIKLTNPNEFDNRWTKIKLWLDNNDDKWDIFLGGVFGVSARNVRKILCMDNNIVQLNFAWTTHFVYYNKKFINTVINNVNPYVNGIDWWNLTCPGIKITTSYPFLAYQYSDHSDILHINRDSWTNKFVLVEKIIRKKIIKLKK